MIHTTLRRVALSLVLGLIAIGSAWARQISPAEALRHIQGSGTELAQSVPMSQLTLSHTAIRDGVTLLYAFDNAGGSGYVIAAADDTFPIVLGYSANGSYADACTVPAFRHWVEESQEIMARTLAQGKAGSVPTVHPRVLPLLTTTWGQGDTKLDAEPHYNIYTPVIRNQSSLVGCTATAMAQIMKYYAYPERGQGSHTYDCSGYGTVSEDFDVEYQWDLMQDHYGFTVLSGDTINVEFSPEANEAVSLLSYHCGVAAEMQYSPTASGAWELYGARGMVRHFGYDRGIHGEQRTFYNDREWDEVIYAELAAGRPVIYVAYIDEVTGHTFITDGYINGLYHINWGWNGLAEGYYSLLGTEALHPKEQRKGGQFVYDAFAVKHSAVLGIQPARADSPLCPTLGLESTYTVTAEDALTPVTEATNGSEYYLHSRGLIHNYSCTELTVRYGIRLVDTASGRHYEFKDRYNTMAQMVIYQISGAEFMFVPNKVPDGTYEVRIVYTVDGEDGWYEVQTTPDFTVPTLTFSDGIEPEPDPEPEPEPEPDGIHSPTLVGSAAAYDLSGRRTTGAGIVITGGRKVVR